MPRILNFGSLNIDYVYSVPHFVRPGETLSSHALALFCGGKGLNQSIALCRAGMEVFHAGKIGVDGDFLLDELNRHGVNTVHVARTDGRTGHAIIQVDESGQNCILLYGGANQALTEQDVDAALAPFGPGDWALVQNEINLLPYILKRAKAKGLKIAMNPSPISPALLESGLDLVDLFILNEIEAEAITGDSDVEAMCEKMRALFPRAEVVLTLGKEGSVYLHEEQRESMGIYKVKAVDTTAAGDTFLGFFIARKAQGSGPKEALRTAAAASALAVSRQGAAASIPSLEEALRAAEELPRGV